MNTIKGLCCKILDKEFKSINQTKENIENLIIMLEEEARCQEVLGNNPAKTSFEASARLIKAVDVKINSAPLISVMVQFINIQQMMIEEVVTMCDKFIRTKTPAH